jgi:hypothetical protein
MVRKLAMVQMTEADSPTRTASIVTYRWSSLLRRVTVTSLPLQRHNNTVIEAFKKVYQLHR